MNFLSGVRRSFSGFFNSNMSDRICVIGGANIDILGSSLSLKKDDSAVGKISLFPGGIARNVAENLGRLDIPTTFISAIGDDFFGDILNKSLVDVGVYVSGVRRIGNKSSGAFMVISDDIKEIRYSVNDMDIFSELNRGWINNCKDIVTKSKALVIDCNLKHEALDEIFNIYSGKVFVNTVSTAKSLNIIPYLNKVWAVNLNIKEAEVLAGLKIDDEKTAYDAIRSITDKGAHKVAIDLEDGGLIFSDSDNVFKFSYSEDKFVNRGGSEETFTATWVASEYMGVPNIDSIKNAIVATRKNSLIRENVNKNLTRASLNEWVSSFPIEITKLDF